MRHIRQTFAAAMALAASVAPAALSAETYLVSWSERPGGSPADYEAAQERVLQLFQGYEFPESVTIQRFLVRVGTYGGTMIVETDDLQKVHEFTSIFATFAFEVIPVLEVGDAVAAEVAAITYRKGLDTQD